MPKNQTDEALQVVTQCIKRAHDYLEWFTDEANTIAKTYGHDDTPYEVFEQRMDSLLATVHTHQGGDDIWWVAQVMPMVFKQFAEMEKEFNPKGLFKRVDKGKQNYSKLLLGVIMSEFMYQVFTELNNKKGE